MPGVQSLPNQNGKSVAPFPGAPFLEASVLLPVFDVTAFTFWVGLHLVSSDLFSVLKRIRST